MNIWSFQRPGVTGRSGTIKGTMSMREGRVPKPGERIVTPESELYWLVDTVDEEKRTIILKEHP